MKASSHNQKDDDDEKEELSSNKLPPSASSPELRSVRTAPKDPEDSQKHEAGVNAPPPNKGPTNFFEVMQAAFEKARSSATGPPLTDPGPDNKAPEHRHQHQRHRQRRASEDSSGSSDAAPHQSVGQKFQRAVEEGMGNLQMMLSGQHFSSPPRSRSSISIIGRTDSTAARAIDPEAAIEEEFRTSSSDMEKYLEKYGSADMGTRMEKLAGDGSASQGGGFPFWSDFAPSGDSVTGSGVPVLEEGELPDTPLAPNKTHLMVLCNGVNGHWKNWREFLSLAAARPELSHIHLHAGRTNLKSATFDGIDVCGERLIEEMRALAKAGSGTLTHISIIGHSMGGLICRYVIGKLFDPATGTILGLEPTHFVTLATPHLGCDGAGVSQVPLLSWAGDAPLVGNFLQKAMVDVAPAFTAKIFGRSGEQLFMQDAAPPSAPSPSAPSPSPSPFPSSAANGSSPRAQQNNTDNNSSSSSSSEQKQQQQQEAKGSSAEQKGGGGRVMSLIERLTTDTWEDGFYLEGLRAFRTRTAYANVSGDHVVGWANSSLRFQGELPPIEVFEESPIFDAGISCGSPQLPSSPRTNGGSAEGVHQKAPRSPTKMRCFTGSETATRFPSELSTAAPSSPTLARNASAGSALLGPLPSVKVETYINATVHKMLLRLQSMSWRRVDISFKRHLIGFMAHNHIQVTRKWLNKAGMPTVEHLLQTLVDMEEDRLHRLVPVASGDKGRATAAEAAAMGAGGGAVAEAAAAAMGTAGGGGAEAEAAAATAEDASSEGAAVASHCVSDGEADDREDVAAAASPTAGPEARVVEAPPL